MQARVVQAAKGGEVAQALLGDRAHRVQPQELEPGHAEVDAADGVVAQPPRPQRAAVADAVIEDAPRVGEVVSILPEYLRHFDEGTGPGMPGRPVGQEVTPPEAAGAGVDGGRWHGRARLARPTPTVGCSTSPGRVRPAAGAGENGPPRRAFAHRWTRAISTSSINARQVILWRHNTLIKSRP